MDQKFVYYKHTWFKRLKTLNHNDEEYSHIKNGYFFHDINEFVNFTNINDEDEIEF